MRRHDGLTSSCREILRWIPLVLSLIATTSAAQIQPMDPAQQPQTPSQSPRGYFSSHSPADARTRALFSTNVEARIRAARELRYSPQGGETVELLSLALGREAASSVRSEIANSLAFLGDPSASAALIEAFEGSSSRLEEVANALAELRTEEGLAALIAAVDRSQSRTAALASLKRIGPWATTAIMQRVIEEESLLGLRLLGALGDPAAVPLLLRMTAHEAGDVRTAALGALAQLQDPRARNAARHATTDDNPAVAMAGWRTLAAVATTADAEAIVSALDEGVLVEDMLVTLLRIAPRQGAAQIAARASGEDIEQVRLAASIAMRIPVPELSSVLHGLVREGSRRAPALAALAETPLGQGIPVLLRLPAGADVVRALAVALRRWPNTRWRSQGLERLRSLALQGPLGPRHLILRALARDSLVLAPLERRLQSDDPAQRGWAAAGLELLEQGREAIETAAVEEENVEVFRRLVRAAQATQGHIPEAAIERFAHEPSAELAVMAAMGLRDLTRSNRRRLRISLRSPLQPTMLTAALTLAGAGDSAALGALFTQYDQEDSPRARRVLAAVIMKLVARSSETRRRFGAAVEARRRAATNLEREFWREGSMPSSGRRVLRFEIAAEQSPEGTLCQIELPGGQTRLQHTLPSGELFIADLPAGTADVRPVL